MSSPHARLDPRLRHSGCRLWGKCSPRVVHFDGVSGSHIYQVLRETIHGLVSAHVDSRPSDLTYRALALGDAPHSQASTRTLNPPQNIRLPSKGMALGSIMFATRGSFMTLALI